MDLGVLQFDSLDPAAERDALLRAFADGELAERELVSRIGPLTEADRAMVQFEQKLRRSVGNEMSCSGAPPELRARVQQLLESDCSPAAEPVTIAIGPWLNGRVVGPFAAAAALAIAAAGVWYMYQRATPPPAQIATSSLLLQTASAAIDTHRERASSSLWAIKKTAARDEDATRAMCKEWLGHEPDLSSLCAESVELVGAGMCDLPNVSGRSVHILVTAPCHGGVRRDVSLFIMHDEGKLEVESFGIKDVGGRCSSNAAAYVWRENGLIYLLVSRNAEVAGTIADQLGIEPWAP